MPTSEEAFELHKKREKAKHNKSNPQEEPTEADSPQVMLERNAVNDIL